MLNVFLNRKLHLKTIPLLVVTTFILISNLNLLFAIGCAEISEDIGKEQQYSYVETVPQSDFYASFDKIPKFKIDYSQKRRMFQIDGAEGGDVLVSGITDKSATYWDVQVSNPNGRKIPRLGSFSHAVSFEKEEDNKVLTLHQESIFVKPADSDPLPTWVNSATVEKIGLKPLNEKGIPIFLLMTLIQCKTMGISYGELKQLWLHDLVNREVLSEVMAEYKSWKYLHTTQISSVEFDAFFWQLKSLRYIRSIIATLGVKPTLIMSALSIKPRQGFPEIAADASLGQRLDLVSENRATLSINTLKYSLIKL